MTGTSAVPNDWLAKVSVYSGGAGRPLCPQCRAGYLHPFLVEIGLENEGLSWHGADYLVGWVAVCAGNQNEVDNRAERYRAAGSAPPDDDEFVVPCGFSMPMQAKRRARAGEPR